VLKIKLNSTANTEKGGDRCFTPCLSNYFIPLLKIHSYDAGAFVGEVRKVRITKSTSQSEFLHELFEKLDSFDHII
jgi:hypothetical protein